VLAILISLAACDEGGAIYLSVDNTTSEPVLARASGSRFNPNRPYAEVFPIPSHSRLALAKLTIAGGVQINQVEILDTNCSLVGYVNNFNQRGWLIVVSDGPRVELRDEAPSTGVLATPTQQCSPTG
jgi:hypothetical protein